MKVLTVFGTRPEAIKLAPVVLELRKTKGVKSFVCVTGQHREMLDQVLKVFGIKPDFDLNIMKKDQTLEDIVSGVMVKIAPVLDKVKPDIVLVQGDTTSAFIVALAAFFKKIKVGHVEAGLRTNDKFNPFPEEINRRLVSHVADLHFAPTKAGRENLLGENVDPATVFVTGNTVIDALLEIAGKREQGTGNRVQGEEKKIILVTAHRRESFGKDFENICTALKEIALGREDVEIIYPVHLNPNVRRPVNKIIKGVPGIHLVEPMEYEPFVRLMKRSYIILSDSGGIQEEAPSLDKPVLVMRHVTERPEGVNAGCAKLVGTEAKDIVKNVIRLLDDKKAYAKMAKAKNPYGDGKAAKKIVAILKRELR